MLGLSTLRRKSNGNAADPLTLAAQLAEIQSAIDALPGRQAELAEHRLAALRRDDDAEARAIEAQQADLKRDKDRLTDSHHNIGEQLRAARAAADKRADDAKVSEYLDLSAAVAQTLEAADSAAAVQRMFWDRNSSCLSRPGIQPLGAVLILGSGHGIAWAQRTRQVIAEVQRRLSGQPAASPQKLPQPLPSSALRQRQRLPHERPRMADTKSTVTLADAAPGMHSAAREPDDLAPLEPGEARVRVMRHGYSPADNRPHCSFGQVVRMPLAHAGRAADRGAVVVVEVYGETVLHAEGASQAPAFVPPQEEGQVDG